MTSEQVYVGIVLVQFLANTDYHGNPQPFIFRGSYKGYFGGVKASYFMGLGSKGTIRNLVYFTWLMLSSQLVAHLLITKHSSVYMGINLGSMYLDRLDPPIWHQVLVSSGNGH